MSKPEAGQLTVNDLIAIGKAASFLRFEAAYKTHATDEARKEWKSVADALTDIECRCQPQPAEDPDEWVIQDRVPVRVMIDRCWYMDGECGLPADPEDMWQKYNKDQFLDGKKHGDYVRDGGGTLHVMCRRRDLPKVEQAAAQPACDECGGSGEVDSGGFTSWMAPINVPCGKCSQPQPQKTRVRLWIEGPTKMIMCRDKAPYGDWQEIHHDSEGFYVEGGQS